MNRNLIFRKCIKYCNKHPEKEEKYLCSCGSFLCEDCFTTSVNPHFHSEMELFLLNNEHDVYKELLENYMKKNAEYQRQSKFSLEAISSSVFSGLRVYFGALLRKETESINNLLKKKCALIQQKTKSSTISCEDVCLLGSQSRALDKQISLEIFSFKVKKNELSANFKEKMELIFADLFDVLDFHLLKKKSFRSLLAEKHAKQRVKNNLKFKLLKKFNKKFSFSKKFDLKKHGAETSAKALFDPLIDSKLENFQNSDIYDAIRLQRSQAAECAKENFSELFTKNELFLEAFENKYNNNLNFENEKINSNEYYNFNFKDNYNNNDNESNSDVSFKNSNLKKHLGVYNDNSEENKKALEDESFKKTKNTLEPENKSAFKANALTNINNFTEVFSNKNFSSAINFSAKGKRAIRKNSSFEANRNEFDFKIQSEKTKTLQETYFSKALLDKQSSLTAFSTSLLKACCPEKTFVQIPKNEFIGKSQRSFSNKKLPKIASTAGSSNKLNVFNLLIKDEIETEKEIQKAYDAEENKNEENAFSKSRRDNKKAFCANASLNKKINFDDCKYLKKDFNSLSSNLKKPYSEPKINPILKKQVLPEIEKFLAQKEKENKEFNSEANSKISLNSSCISSFTSSSNTENISFVTLNANFNPSKNADLSQSSFETVIEPFAFKINKIEDILNVNLTDYSKAKKLFNRDRILSQNENETTEKKQSRNLNKQQTDHNLKAKKLSESQKQLKYESYFISESRSFNTENENENSEQETSTFENHKNLKKYKNPKNYTKKNQTDKSLEKLLEKMEQKTLFKKQSANQECESDQILKGNVAKIAQLLDRKKASNKKKKIILPYKIMKHKHKVKKFQPFTHSSIAENNKNKKAANFISFYDKLAASKELEDEIYSLEHHFKCLYYGKNITLRAAKCICLKQMLGIKPDEKKKTFAPPVSAVPGKKVQVRCEECKKFFSTGEDTVHFRKKCFICFENSKMKNAGY